MWAKIITIKRTKDLNYFSLCALNWFNTQVSQFELNYWNKWTFPQNSKLLRCICLYNYRWLSIYIVRLLFYTHAHRYYFIHYIFVRCNKSSDKQQKTILYWNFLIRSVRCKRNHVWWWFLSSPLVLSRLTTAVVFFCPAVAAGMH